MPASAVATGTGTLRFEVVGSSLKLFLNGSVAAYANDTSLMSGGSVGVYNGMGTAVDNFSGSAMPLNNNNPLPFSDNFSTATNQQLSSNWLNQAGNFQVANGVATGNGTLNIATVNGINVADVAVQADVTLAAGQYASLMARYSGTGYQNLYLAVLSNTDSGYMATICLILGGTPTQLMNVVVSVVNPKTLRFLVSGNSLQLYVNGIPQGPTVTDSTLTTGTVGMWTGMGVSVDNFNAM